MSVFNKSISAIENAHVFVIQTSHPKTNETKTANERERKRKREAGGECHTTKAFVSSGSGSRIGSNGEKQKSQMSNYLIQPARLPTVPN